SADQGTWKQWDHPQQAPQRRAFAVRLIQQRNPDLIGFQEGEDTQLDYLRANLPEYTIRQQRPSGGSGAENAAFAYSTNRLALLDSGVFSLGPSPGGGYWNNTPGTNFSPWIFFPDMGLGFPRIALWGRFRWRATGQEFLFYTTHFDFNDTPQQGSARLITDDAQSRNRLMPMSPLAMVVGDFNSSQNNNDWKLFTGALTNQGITGDFTDSWQQARGTWTASGTFHGFAGGTPAESDRIDWILHRGGFLATNATVVSDSTPTTNTSTHVVDTLYPSDHYPVTARLCFPAPALDGDGDGIPDALEEAGGKTLSQDADTDNDGLVDGLEDLNGNGLVEGGETDPTSPGDPFNPTDIRHYMMDGILDPASVRLAENNGMDLWWRFDGRYLYVATWDAGDGNDHFIFLSRHPETPVAAPWAKAGQVAQFDAYLADENDNTFCGWFDASGVLVTNLFLARAAAYFENGGRLEGVIDLGALYGTGFTQAFYLAVATYENGTGGALQSPWQVPAGNGDGHLLGTNEFARLVPGDLDSDGTGDAADPDRDGDGLPDSWETVFGLDPLSALGDEGRDGDPDGDGQGNLNELLSGTSPMDSGSFFGCISYDGSGAAWRLHWTPIVGKTCYVYEARAELGFSNGLPWSCIATSSSAALFLDFPPSSSRSAVYRVGLGW
ncbi:MAG: endonuclease/exonuclease/phosphatase family protein, partial [Lentisphaerota bacterium]